MCIFLRHLSLAEKFYFFATLWTVLLWKVNRMHPVQHLSTYLNSAISGTTHVFTVNGTNIMWVELSKEPHGEGPRALLKASGSWASESQNSLLNSSKNPRSVGLRPKREFSISCQYTMIQW